MIVENRIDNLRDLKTEDLQADFVIVGGGLAGVCAAIAAGRNGAKTILVQDRPVLGGNASSEVRLWALGATSHMGNNNRWSREGGILDEILVENLFRNKEGNPVIFDTVLLEKVREEENITLLLNTAVSGVEKHDGRNIKAISAFNSQNSVQYIINAPLFCDASGDGVVGYLAGAGFRMGAETKEEFGELFAPDETYGHLLGHSMFFYSKETDKPVKYVAPSYALKDISSIPKYKVVRKNHKGCNFWWFEYGGRKDTVHDTEEIKWELWKVIYGVWDYIKNSGEFEGVENLTLEWVANIPGKRESRRFEGLYMMRQQDVVEQRRFYDAVAFGGWALDLHPADGVYTKGAGCTQWHSKGVYDIPYRSYVCRDVDNLFLAGRIISASHVAFGSTRVMLTCGFGGQAVGTAAALCAGEQIKPAQVLANDRIKTLQQWLCRDGQSIPDVPVEADNNLSAQAAITASSELELSQFSPSDSWLSLNVSAAQLLPLQKDKKYSFTVFVKAEEDTILETHLRISENPKNFTPEVTLNTQRIELKKGEQKVKVAFNEGVQEDMYAFVTFMANPKISLKESDQLVTGTVTVFNGENEKVSNTGTQTPPPGIGVDSFEFWIPNRRPEGKNIAMEINPAIDAFGTDNIGNGLVRPRGGANAWVADLNDPAPKLNIQWEEEKEIRQIRLFFDTDYDHAMESAQYGHPEDIIPFCVRNYTIKTIEGQIIKTVKGNHQTINTVLLDKPLSAKGISIEVEHPSSLVPASIFEVLVQ